jgi:triacylglycerol lipase
MFVLLFSINCQPIENDDILDPLEFVVKGEDTATSIDANPQNNEPASDSTTEPENECLSERDQPLSDGMTEHFQLWLSASNYDVELERSDISGGSFGGLVSSDDCLKNRPVVFIHGNSDRATGGIYGGFEQLTTSMKDYGYRSSELYATTYGSALLQDSTLYSHNQENIRQVRQFIKAVLEYTGSEKVDVVAHSLGVTIARKAILGGVSIDDDGTGYDLGGPLTQHIETFVGIAGANQGLVNCLSAINTPICSTGNGLYPGSTITEPSTFLQNINSQSRYEGNRIYSLWSVADEIILYGCMLGTKNTCQIPEQDGQKQYYTLGHFQLKEQTGDVIYSMLQETYVDETEE